MPAKHSLARRGPARRLTTGLLGAETESARRGSAGPPGAGVREEEFPGAIGNRGARGRPAASAESCVTIAANPHDEPDEMPGH
jgi:hypothetical protein